MIRAIVVVKLPLKVAHKPDFGPVTSVRSKPMGRRGSRPQSFDRPVGDASPLLARRRQYTEFPNPAMAFFAHPIEVRLSYFKTLDHKSRIGLGNGVSPHVRPTAWPPGHGQIMAIPP